MCDGEALYLGAEGRDGYMLPVIESHILPEFIGEDEDLLVHCEVGYPLQLFPGHHPPSGVMGVADVDELSLGSYQFLESLEVESVILIIH